MEKKLIALDWDKCCNGEGGPGVPWDLNGLATLGATIADVAKKGFGVCMLTGRGSAYGLAVVEALGLVEHHPGLWSGFEGGLIMSQHTPAWPCEYAACVDDEYMGARETLEKTLTPGIINRGGKQEKKEICLTYNPPPEMSLGELLKMVKMFVEDAWLNGLVNCTRTNSAVDIWPKGGSKEDNILELCRRNGVDPKNTIYIDDAPGGIPVFNVVGFSGAPANASPEVKDAAGVVAKSVGPYGVSQIIRFVACDDDSGIARLNKA